MTGPDTATGRPPADGRSTSPADVVAFLGLTDVVAPDRDGRYAFGLGTLYPHTCWLSSVLSRFAATADDHPRSVPWLFGEAPAPGDAPLEAAARVAVAGYLAAIDDLQDHIAFAPGPAGARVGAAGRRVAVALAPSWSERRRR